MSLATFKKKSIINYGSKRSGSAPGGYWIPQGPFGQSTTGLQLAIKTPGPSGFSINGSTRNTGYVGKTYKMSKSGTPYRGTQPIGFGGKNGTYPSPKLKAGIYPNKSQDSQPLLNATEVNTLGTQYQYVKPSVLSNKGMLSKKYRWAYNGKYPNYWVQPIYTGNQTDNASQGIYIQNIASANTCKLNVNNVQQYEGYNLCSHPTTADGMHPNVKKCTKGIYTSGLRYNDIARNTHYTKTLYQPTNYTQYNLHLKRSCNNPIGDQKPFPFSKPTGVGLLSGGISVTNVGNACNTSNNNYLEPPAWYTAVTSNPDIKENPQTTTFTTQL